MQDQEDKAITNCKAGHLEDFEILYERYFSRIYAFIYYRVGHRETVEDLTSITFMKAIERIDSFENGSFSAWLYSIARNNVIDHYRSDKSKRTSSLEEAFGLGALDQSVSTLDNTVLIRDIQKFLQTLPSDQRDITIMRLWDELSYKEIAEIVGKSEDNCKMIFCRSISKVRAEFAVALLIVILNSFRI